MKELRWKQPTRQEGYPTDITILEEALSKHSYNASRRDIENAWSDYSESYAAGWLNVRGTSIELVNILLEFMEEK